VYSCDCIYIGALISSVYVCVYVCACMYRLSLVSHALSEERERNESLVIHLKQVESELFEMRRRNELLESDREKYRTLIATLNETVTRIRIVS